MGQVDMVCIKECDNIPGVEVVFVFGGWYGGCPCVKWINCKWRGVEVGVPV